MFAGSFRVTYCKAACLFIAPLLFFFTPQTGLAGTFAAFGPQNDTRGSGGPVTVTDGFAVINPNVSYTLQIYNGGLEDGAFEKVSISVISLNGIQMCYTYHRVLVTNQGLTAQAFLALLLRPGMSGAFAARVQRFLRYGQNPNPQFLSQGGLHGDSSAGLRFGSRLPVSLLTQAVQHWNISTLRRGLWRLPAEWVKQETETISGSRRVIRSRSCSERFGWLLPESHP